MAGTGLNSNSGIGTGEAQVYQTGSNVDLYGKIMAQQEAQRQAELKKLVDEQNKIKIDGLRDADKPEFFNKYNEWKGMPAQIQSERDPYKKMQLQSEFDKRHIELDDFINKSKQYGADDHEFGNRLLDDKFRNQFADHAVDAFHQNTQLPMSDPKYIKDKSTLERQIDLSKVDNDLTQLETALAARAKYDNPQTTEGSDKKGKYTEYQYSKTVPPEVQAEAYATKYLVDKDFKAFLQKTYADLYGQMPDQEATAMAIKDLVSKRPIVRHDAPKREYEKIDNFYDHRDYAVAHPMPSRAGSGSGDVGEPQEYTMAYGDGTNVKGNVTFPQYVGVSIPGKNFAGAPTIDLRTGKPGAKLSSSNDYETVGVGNVPVMNHDMKAGSTTIRKGSIAQPDFVKKGKEGVDYDMIPVVHVQQKSILPNGKPTDHFVPYDRLPENVKNSKSIREALAKFKPANGQKQAPAQSPEDVSALNWLKANPKAPQAAAIRENLKKKGLIK